ncbi:helix-turn-helix domain-containing protein [Pseudoflavonifractor phocaeensis]|uniref:helix-turn-helix domain-containing protein n=1 Tax=Pseudoflavonifractor phocaeensis TaxID=1870988 RepID=UPI001F3F69A0|nr:helix-turn-helix domain-containing protein [Pseudoflavonifractor phocaeensis]MCF2660756.1 helix-turn-helix domain-containing protein [Pseudoflavonifractor phocaeensis]
MSAKKNAMVMPMPLLVNAKELARISGIGENTIRRLMDAGELEYLQVGSHRLLRLEAILDYYERHKTPIRSVQGDLGRPA